MSNLTKGIWEHLITKRKYNKLRIRLETKNEELEEKVIQMNTQKRIHDKQRETWERTFEEQEEKIIELKKEIKRLRLNKRNNERK